MSSLPQAFKLTGDAGPCTTKPVISHASAIAPFQLALSFSLPQALRLMGDAETIGIYVVASASTRRPFTAALLFLRTCSGVKKSYYTCMNLLLPRHYVNYALNILCSRTGGGYEVLEMVMTFQT